VSGVSELILRRLPRQGRKPVQVAARIAAAVSLLVWLALGLPLLSQIGAATLTYFAVLALPVLAWRGFVKATRKAGRRKRRR
jgi:uncharacterized membrane protein YphA (DoxX/SURF4 family)